MAAGHREGREHTGLENTCAYCTQILVGGSGGARVSKSPATAAGPESLRILRGSMPRLHAGGVLVVEWTKRNPRRSLGEQPGVSITYTQEYFNMSLAQLMADTRRHLADYYSGRIESSGGCWEYADTPPAEVAQGFSEGKTSLAIGEGKTREIWRKRTDGGAA